MNIEAKDGQVIVFDFSNPVTGPELAVYVYGTFMGTESVSGVGLNREQARELVNTIVSILVEGNV